MSTCHESRSRLSALVPDADRVLRVLGQVAVIFADSQVHHAHVNEAGWSIMRASTRGARSIAGECSRLAQCVVPSTGELCRTSAESGFGDS